MILSVRPARIAAIGTLAEIAAGFPKSDIDKLPFENKFLFMTSMLA
jgi:hypothetical protein